MATETRTMKLAITNEQEIEQLKDLCSQIEEFGKELRTYNYEDLDLTNDKDYYTILYPIWKGSDSIEEFMEAVFKEFDAVHHGRILFNLSTLLDNCADKNLTHLDFNPEIKKGFEAIELLKEIDEYIKPSTENYIGFDSVLHSKIKKLIEAPKVSSN